MIKAIEKVSDKEAGPIEAHKTIVQKEIKEEAIDLARLLADLKTREAKLNRLQSEGGNKKEIGELKTELSTTIVELEGILADPETAELSKESELG